MDWTYNQRHALVIDHATQIVIYGGLASIASEQRSIAFWI